MVNALSNVLFLPELVATLPSLSPKFGFCYRDTVNRFLWGFWLVRNPEKPIISLYGTKWSECDAPPSPPPKPLQRNLILPWAGAGNSVYESVRWRHCLWSPMSEGRQWCSWNRHVQSCVHRHSTHPDQRPLRPFTLFQPKPAIWPAANVGHGLR